MKNVFSVFVKSKKKILSAVLSVIMLFSLCSPLSSVAASAEAKPGFEIVDNPELLYQLSDVTGLSAPGASLDFQTANVAEGAPVISGCTETAKPGESIVIEGKGFNDATVTAYGTVDGIAEYREAAIIKCSDTTITAVIDSDFDNGVIIVWVRNSVGYSRPVRINNATASWSKRGTNEVEVTDDGFGTFEDGVAGRDIRFLPLLPQFENYDFEQGFRYWGSRFAGNDPTINAEVVTSAGNTYLKHNTATAYNGITSAVFYLDNVAVGDKLGVFWNHQGSATAQVRLNQVTKITASSINATALVGSATAYIAATQEKPWATYGPSMSGTVLASEMTDGKYAFYFEIVNSAINVDSLIDNIRILKKNLSDGKWYTLDGQLADQAQGYKGAEEETTTNGTAKEGAIKIYGKNLNINGKTEVWLKNEISAYKADVTTVQNNPYELSFTTPQNIPAGEYDVFVHNGTGGNYGWSSPIKFTVGQTATVWSQTTVTVADTTEAAINAAIATANDYDTVYFPNGTYTVNSSVTVNKALKFVGESKDGVKIISNITNVTANGLFKINKLPTYFENISFEDVLNGDGVSVAFIKSSKYTNPTDNVGLTVKNCDFLKHNTYSITNTVKVDNKNYNIVDAAISVSTVDNIIIKDNTFTVPVAMELRNATGIEVSGNIIYGTWICTSKKQGSSGIFVVASNEVVIENNTIWGYDKITDPDGELSVGDKTVNRAIVLQNTTVENENSINSKNIYISNNNIDRVGHLDDNSGEQILFENLGIQLESGVSSVDGKALSLYSVIDSAKASGYVGDFVMISKGNGAGQYRTITAVSGNTITVDKAWDLAPDATSTVVVLNGMENTVIFGNKINGPESFYKNSNATAGIQAYANMLDLVVSGNEFSNLTSGVRITMHYSTNGGTGYSFFTNLLIADNEINNVRYGIILRLDNMSWDTNVLDTPVPAHLLQNAVIRDNVITNARYSEDANLNGIGGVAIAVGSDYKTYSNQNPSKIWTGDWIKNTVIEQNNITSAADCAVRLMFHQADTILKGNICDSNTEMLKYDGSNVALVDRATEYEDLTTEVDDGYGTHLEGISGNPDVLIDRPLEHFRNGDFSEGLKYWGDYKMNGSYTCTNAARNASIIEDGIFKMMPEQRASQIVSAPFILKDHNYNETIYVSFKYKIFDLTGVSTDDKIRVALQMYRDGKWKEMYNFRVDSSTSAYQVAVEDGWLRYGITLTANTTLNWLESDFADGKTPVYRAILQYEVIRDENGTAINGTNPNNHYFLMDDIKFTQYDGSYYDGIYDSWSNVSNNRTVLDAPQNLDFADGLMHWSALGVTGSSTKNYASKYAKVMRDGYVKLQNVDTAYLGIGTTPFNMNFDTTSDMIMTYDCRAVNSANKFRVRVLRNGNSTDGSSFNAVSLETLDDGWVKYKTGIIKAGDLSPDDKLLIRIEQTDLSYTGDAYFDNIEFRYVDKGNSNLYAQIDGTPIDYEYGDANYDGSVDLRDMIRAKKYSAGSTNDIYFAALNIDKYIGEDGNVDWYAPTSQMISSADLIQLQRILLGVR